MSTGTPFTTDCGFAPAFRSPAACRAISTCGWLAAPRSCCCTTTNPAMAATVAMALSTIHSGSARLISTFRSTPEPRGGYTRYLLATDGAGDPDRRWPRAARRDRRRPRRPSDRHAPRDAWLRPSLRTPCRRRRRARRVPDRLRPPRLWRINGAARPDGRRLRRRRERDRKCARFRPDRRVGPVGRRPARARVRGAAPRACRRRGIARLARTLRRAGTGLLRRHGPGERRRHPPNA